MYLRIMQLNTFVIFVILYFLSCSVNFASQLTFPSEKDISQNNCWDTPCSHRLITTVIVSTRGTSSIYTNGLVTICRHLMMKHSYFSRDLQQTCKMPSTWSRHLASNLKASRLAYSWLKPSLQVTHLIQLQKVLTTHSPY